MSNGARHLIGAVIGLIVTPIIAACLLYGTSKLSRFLRILAFEGNDRWVGAGVLLVAAVLVGLVAGTRVSPLASLVPGAVFAFAGTLWVAAPRWSFEHSARDVLTGEFRNGYLMVAPSGVLLVLGFGLLAASLAPSRWQARNAAGRVAAPRYGAPPPAPMGPPMQAAPAPLGAPHAPPPSQAPQAPGQSSPPWQGTPQYGQAPSNPPPLPPTPPASERPKPSSGSGPDDDEPGEWTRVYGGNR